MRKKSERLNVLFPKEVAEALRESIPEGERSRFISEATRKELHRYRLLKILDKAAGAWTDGEHPDLQSIDDIHRWLEEMRRPGEERISKLRGE